MSAGENKDTCGCCKGVNTLTPAEIENRPGLSAVAYRVGTHARFKATMQAALSRKASLREKLTSRDGNDFAIALLDAWSTVADVLTFYQERIANESYLRTASERRSILELARLIGYELSPGVAAGTYLVFRMEDPPRLPGGSDVVTDLIMKQQVPRQITIEAGTRVQSTPGQDELPQVFETIEKIDARADWNELKPQKVRCVPPELGHILLYVKGVSTRLRAGDAILLIGAEREKDLSSENWDFRKVKEVLEVNDANPLASYTILKLDLGLGSLDPYVQPSKQGTRLYALRQRASQFGYNAPDWRSMPDSLQAGYLGKSSKEEVDIKTYSEWPEFNLISLAGARRGLYGEYFAGTDFDDRRAVQIDSSINFPSKDLPAGVSNSESFCVRWSGFIVPAKKGKYTLSVQSDGGYRLWIGKGPDQLKGPLISNWKGIEGTKSEYIELDAKQPYSIRLEYRRWKDANKDKPRIQLYWKEQGQAEKAIIDRTNLYPPEIQLDSIYSTIVPDSWVVLSTPDYQEVYRVRAAVEDSQANFALASKTMRLTLSGENLHLFNNKLRETAVFCQSELLELADQPVTEEVEGDRVTLERKVEDLPNGRTLVLTGRTVPDGLQKSEVITLLMTDSNSNGKTRLILSEKLKDRYRRDTVTIFGNVARATHGETVQEVLGSGDAGSAFQRFALRQAPLTHVSAQTSTGRESTLELRVNDVLWKGVPRLNDHGPEEHIFSTRIENDDTTIIQFGDGRTGARLPTGRENVRAKYRKGSGLAGLVKGGQLNLLITRPLGLKDVFNPLPADGAEDQEQLDQARENAPFTVLSMDRIVSLQDYEDFARAFAGIAKAQAIWVWDGEKQAVFVTVAGPKGADVGPDSRPYKNLLDAIGTSGDPHIPVIVKSYKKILFRISGIVRVDPDRERGKVRAAVEKTLRSRYSFEARSFGQTVKASELLAVIQGVSGVVMARLDGLYRTGERRETVVKDLPAVVPEAAADSTISPAELLMLDPAPLDSLEIRQ